MPFHVVDESAIVAEFGKGDILIEARVIPSKGDPSRNLTVVRFAPGPPGEIGPLPEEDEFGKPTICLIFPDVETVQWLARTLREAGEEMVKPVESTPLQP